MGFGESWQRLLKKAGRSIRTLRRWTKRWRLRALREVPWLASVVQEANPHSVLPKYLAEEAPPGLRREVAEAFRWLDALEGMKATHETDDDVRGWAWANVRLAERTMWF